MCQITKTLSILQLTVRELFHRKVLPCCQFYGNIKFHDILVEVCHGEADGLLACFSNLIHSYNIKTFPVHEL